MILRKKNYEFLIGYHSNFDFECNTERVSIESLSIALGQNPKLLNLGRQHGLINFVAFGVFSADLCFFSNHYFYKN